MPWLRVMVSNKPPRKSTPHNIEAEVLTKSLRRCTLCFSLKNNLKEKHGQIAHLNGDRTDYRIDNLAFMCLKHHSEYDSQTSQHKNYTPREVKAARTRLYEVIAQGQHLKKPFAQQSLEVKADKKILRDLLAVLPSDGIITFLRDHDFGGAFPRDELNPLYDFCDRRNGPDYEFLDPELEKARKKLRASCKALINVLGTYMWRDKVNPGLLTIPRDWMDDSPKRFHSAVKEIHAAVDAVCNSYDDLVRRARKKLAI